MFNLALRNLRIFFRQKSAVFFSLLSVFIILGLYILFLGDVWVNDMQNLPKVKPLMNSWIMAGILSVTAVTTAMGAFGIMVEDKSKKILKDFYAAPLSRVKILGGYVLSAFVIGMIMSVLALVLGQIYVLATGGKALSFVAVLAVLGILLLSVFMSCSIVFFLVSFFTSNAAFATASTVIGTLIGFVTGIYLPIGSLPAAVQWVIKLFPVSHAGALLRQVMCAPQIAVSFAGAPASAIAEFEAEMGVTYCYGSVVAPAWVSVLVLILTGILFFGLALLVVSRKKKS